MRGDDDDFEPIDLLKLVRLGVRRAGHAGQLRIQAEVVLERDGGDRQVFLFDVDPFLGFDRLV